MHAAFGFSYAWAPLASACMFHPYVHVQPCSWCRKKISGLADILGIAECYPIRPELKLVLSFVTLRNYSVTRLRTKRVCVDGFLEHQTPNKNRDGALWSGADGPRPGAGRSATWRRG
jgi:hypothetical protein